MREDEETQCSGSGPSSANAPEVSDWEFVSHFLLLIVPLTMFSVSLISLHPLRRFCLFCFLGCRPWGRQRRGVAGKGETGKCGDRGSGGGRVSFLIKLYCLPINLYHLNHLCLFCFISCRTWGRIQGVDWGGGSGQNRGQRTNYVLSL